MSEHLSKREWDDLGTHLKDIANDPTRLAKLSQRELRLLLAHVASVEAQLARCREALEKIAGDEAVMDLSENGMRRIARAALAESDIPKETP